MPRDSQGIYTLPASAGNPVVPDTLVESAWANGTMDDVALALTDSLPRDGTAPMVGPLTLPIGDPTNGRWATSKAYVDKFVALSTGMPIGSIVAFGGTVAPGGFLLCDGASYPRTGTYAALFAIIGTTFGAVNSSSFNVPNLQDQFIRGKGASRALGSLQSGSIQSHIHPTSTPDHFHAVSGITNAMNSNKTHTHTVSDPTHTHIAGTGKTPTYPGRYGAVNTGIATQMIPDVSYLGVSGYGDTSQNAATGITIAATSVDHTHDWGGNTNSQSVNVSIGATGGAETVPQNMALNYYIKAVQNASGPIPVTGIVSSDEQMISIDSSNVAVPALIIHSNVSYGAVKLDQSGKIPANLLPTGNTSLLGVFDASTGNNPSQEFPATTFLNGDTYVVGVAGTITVYDPATNLAVPTLVSVGETLVYIFGSVSNPNGWYYINAIDTLAVQIGFIPAGNLTSSNVQAALEELDTDKAPKSNPTFTGTAVVDAIDVMGPMGSGGANYGTPGLVWTSAGPGLPPTWAAAGGGGGGTGDVVGPASATADSLARYNGTTGKLLKNGAVIGVDVQAYDAATAKTNAANAWTLQQTFHETKDTVFTITPSATFIIDPANGNIQTVVLNANSTPNVAAIEAGQAVTLMVDDGTGFTITWGVVWIGGTPPALATTGWTVVELWKVGTTLYGAKVGNAA